MARRPCRARPRNGWRPHALLPGRWRTSSAVNHTPFVGPVRWCGIRRSRTSSFSHFAGMVSIWTTSADMSGDAGGRQETITAAQDRSVTIGDVRQARYGFTRPPGPGPASLAGSSPVTHPVAGPGEETDHCLSRSRDTHWARASLPGAAPGTRPGPASSSPPPCRQSWPTARCSARSPARCTERLGPARRSRPRRAPRAVGQPRCLRDRF
jgi:hypothetical protein